MHIIDYVLIGILALGSVGAITSIGKERKPLTSDTAATIVVINVVLIIGIILS